MSLHGQARAIQVLQPPSGPNDGRHARGRQPFDVADGRMRSAEFDGHIRASRILHRIVQIDPRVNREPVLRRELLDARSDFYSLGIIFYEMLTGQKPYTGGSAMEVLQQHVAAPPPVLPTQLSRCQPFLERLLAKSRAERFSTAQEIAAAAAALITSAAGEAPETQLSVG